MSKELPLHGFGGGAVLNFKVVGGEKQPSNPAENTIWVNAANEPTGYAFSATEPAEPADGLVWILVSTNGSVSFNALKKNDLQVYPAKCRQYISGAWVDKEALIYQNGEWIKWRTYLFDNGDECTDLTGGWGSSGYTDSATTFHSGVNNGTVISISGSGTSFGRIGTQAAIDLTDFKLLALNISEIVEGPFSIRLVVRTAKNYDSGKTLCDLSIKTIGEHGIDISELQGEAYVSIIEYSGKTYTDAVWLE